MELWDLYDGEGKKTGHYHVRGKPIPQGYYHLVAFVWTFTPQGKLLLTKRSKEKPGAYLWEVTGGSMLAQEDSLSGAIRELYEETGLMAQPQDLRLLGRRIEGQGIYDHYVWHFDVELSSLQLQETETMDAMLVDYAMLMQLMEDHHCSKPLRFWWHEFQEVLRWEFETNRHE